MHVTIFVSLKAGVLDPQGKTIERSLHTLGYNDIAGVRAGRVFELDIDAASRAAAELRIREICDKLLVNPVIEDYRFEIQDG